MWRLLRVADDQRHHRVPPRTSGHRDQHVRTFRHQLLREDKHDRIICIKGTR